MQPNKYSSYNLNELPEGCKKCVLGEKLVLFISGVCSRNCWYCSLSEKRKNKEVIYANEKLCENVQDVIQEAEESNATSAGITGGDALVCLDKTIEYAQALKSKFGKNFHIHIYLPTKLIDKEKIEKLKPVIDEIRIHPEFLINPEKREFDIEKIKIVSEVIGKNNTGIELPLLPDKKQEIKEFILQVKDIIGFVNLNQFEISDTNFDKVTENYELDDNGYTIKGSLEEGKRLLNELARERTKLKIHFCTAELKLWHQYKNRLLRHKILPYGKRNEDGTVSYLAIYGEKIEGGYYDKKKDRTILSEKLARELKGKHKVELVEEYPTSDGDEVERGEI